MIVSYKNSNDGSIGLENLDPAKLKSAKQDVENPFAMFLSQDSSCGSFVRGEKILCVPITVKNVNYRKFLDALRISDTSGITGLGYTLGGYPRCVRCDTLETKRVSSGLIGLTEDYIEVGLDLRDTMFGKLCDQLAMTVGKIHLLKIFPQLEAFNLSFDFCSVNKLEIAVSKYKNIIY